MIASTNAPRTDFPPVRGFLDVGIAVLAFLLVCAGVIAKSFVFWQSAGTGDIGIRMIWIVILLGIVHWLNSRGVFSTWWRRGSSEIFAAGYGCSVALVLVFIPAKYTPFIYFQF